MENTQCIDYIKQAFELKESKNYKPAIEMLYKALELDNDNVEILSQIGEMYFLLNNYSRALQYFEKALLINPNHINSLDITKKIKERQGDMDEVLNISKKIFEFAPSENSLKNLMNVLIKLKLFCEIEKYTNSEYFTSNVKIECANAYYLNGETEKAKELLAQCDIDNEKTMLLQGKIKFNENNFDAAKEIFNSIGKISQNPEVLNYLGLFELENMNFIEAIKDFSKASNLDKHNSVYYFNLGNAYFYNGWIEEAQKAYQKALYINPENLDYRYALAYLYYDKKDYIKAQNEIDAILENSSAHNQAKVLKALLLAQKKDFIGAKNILEDNLKNGANDDFTKSALSKVYVELNIYKKAEELLNEMIEKNPQNLNYMNDLVEIYIKEKDYEKALELVDKILNINPNYISACILGAKAAYLKEDYEQSKGYAQDAISLDINCAQGYYYLALVREKTNDIEEAIECMKRAILYDLNNSEYYDRMSDLYKEKEDYKTALEYMSEAANIDNSEEYKQKYAQLVKLNRKSK